MQTIAIELAAKVLLWSIVIALTIGFICWTALAWQAGVAAFALILIHGIADTMKTYRTVIS